MDQPEEADRKPTPTELQLRIIGDKLAGRTDKAIARAHKIGERTLRRQLDELAKTLGVDGRGRAALYAEVVRRGWLDLKS